MEELSCFSEEGPIEKRGLLQIDLSPCNGACAVADRLKEFPSELSRVVATLRNDPKAESQHRRKALKKILRNPKAVIDNKECRRLGDAVFVILAPSDFVLLTTNIKDFGSMALALGKEAIDPSFFEKV